MSEICIFAGTTEGRRLAELLAGQPVRVLACVATEYGEALIPGAENIEVSARRLDGKEMEALFQQRHFDAVIDATHPYAVQASSHIEAACRATDTPYLRLNRDGGEPFPDAVYVDSPQAAADYLAGHPGNALLTTGSKELACFGAVPGGPERLYARVLPMAASLQACEAAGFAPSHVIAMQGPFSVEMNAATLKSVRAAYLVTKDSGESGGFREKLEAARQAGARCIVIGRPPQKPGMRFSEVAAWLTERYALQGARDVAVIGIGMGDIRTMTLEADAELRECDCVIGARRMLEATERYGKPAYERIAPKEIVECIGAHPEHRRIAVVMSGDTGFYSGTKRLLPLLEGHRVRVIPGLSSMQVLAARLGVGWDDARAVSLHGREGSVVPELRRCGKVFALTDGSDSVMRICADLCDAGMGDARVAVGERLSYPDERIVRGTAETLREKACAPLSAVLVERPAQPSALPVGMPDEAFERQLGEDGATVPMTKSEVRAVCVSKLRLTEDAVVWDVGAGTGSVSIEAALLCPRGRVFAVERREDAAALIGRNARRFALRNLTVVSGSAPEALAELPAPTHVFIGGSSGNLRQIVECSLEKNPGARVVISAIALETVGEASRLICEMEFEDVEIVQLSVARSRAAGRYHLMSGQNPVWILSMRGKGEARSDEG